MPDSFEELRLQVTLVDNASAQLTALKRELEGMGGSNLQSFKQQTSDADVQLKKLLDTVIKGPEAWLKYAAGLAGAGIAANALTGGITNLIGKLTELGSEMNALGARARSAAMDPADLREISEAVERATGAPTAETEARVERFRQKLGALKGEMISTMMRVPDLGNVGVQIMAKLSADLEKTKVPHEQINLVRKALDEAYDEILRSTGDQNKAQNVRRQLQEATDLGNVVSRKVQEPFKAASDERRKVMAMEQQAGDQILKTQVTIMQNWSRIKNLMLIDFKDSGLAKGMSWLADKLKQISEEMEKRRAAERDQATKGGGEQPSITEQILGKGGPIHSTPGFQNEVLERIQRRNNPPAAQPQRLMDTGQQGGGAALPDLSGIRINEQNWNKMINDPKLQAMGRARIQYADAEGNLSSSPQKAKVVQEQTSEAKKLVDVMRRTNAILAGEVDSKFKLMDTGIGGTRGGIGGGIGGGSGYTGPGGGYNPSNTNPNSNPATNNPPPGANPPPKLPTPLNAPTIPGAGPANIPSLTGTPAGPAARPFATPQLTTFAGAAGIPGQPGTQSGAAPGRPPPGNVDAAGVQGLPGSPSGPAAPRGGGDVTTTAAGAPNAPLPGGTGSSAIYNKLLAAYKNSNVVGTIPADGARYGFKTGSAEEWARFGMIIAAAESDYNPRTAVSNAREQSFGIFQYNHPQVPGGNAFDVDASVKQFVSDSESSMNSHGNLGPGSLLYRRFSTIQNTPPPTRARQADVAIETAKRQPVAPTAAPGAPPTVAPSATNLPLPGTVPPGSMTTAGVQPPPGVAPARTAPPGQQAEPAPSATGTNNTAPSAAVLAQARQMATMGPAQLSKFMRDSGYPQHDQWCGDFAATVVKNAGGTPPDNWQVASNWRNYGEAVNAPQPGDVAIAKPGWSKRGPGTTGYIGSHVTIVSGVDPETGQFTGTGGNQGQRNRQFNTRQFEFRRAPVQQPPVTTTPQQASQQPPQPLSSDEIRQLQQMPEDPRLGPGHGPKARIEWLKKQQQQKQQQQGQTLPQTPQDTSYLAARRDMPPEPEVPAILRGGRQGRVEGSKPLTLTNAIQDVEPDRAALDRGLAGRLWAARKQQLAARAKIDVTVANKGQQSTDQPGPFKRVAITRHTQMRKAEEGPKSAPPMQGGGNDHDPELDS